MKIDTPAPCRIIKIEEGKGMFDVDISVSVGNYNLRSIPQISGFCVDFESFFPLSIKSIVQKNKGLFQKIKTKRKFSLGGKSPFRTPWIWRMVLVLLLFLLLRTVWAVDRLETNQLILKECFEEVKAKHNTLKEIVKGMYERGR